MRINYIFSVIIITLMLSGCGEATRENDSSTSTATYYSTSTLNTPNNSTSVKKTTEPTPVEKKPIITPTSSIVIGNFDFNSNSIKVKVGTKVTWTNNDAVAHTVKSDHGTELSSQLLNTGDSYSHTFKSVGTFWYHCGPHPFMNGSVTVTE